MKKNLASSLAVKNDNKIVLLVLDGMGGLPLDGKTELEKAAIPNLDRLAADSVCGLSIPIEHGITPGSGPSHLALFGYDPLEFDIGRGVLEALGVGIKLTARDISARGNFATAGEDGVITDRRAGRISTEKNIEICGALSAAIKEIDGIEVIIKPGKEHRMVVVFRGDNLSGPLTDSDPQREGQKALTVTPMDEKGAFAAGVVNKFLAAANSVLKSFHPANHLMLRGIDKVPAIPPMSALYGLKTAAIATYPMYRGLASLVGMDLLKVGGETVKDEIDTLAKHYSEYDFFYVHVKKTDSYGEDGNFDRKVAVLEEVDGIIPRILELSPSVLAVTADHSTPALMKGHSWHPNPFCLHSKYERTDLCGKFSEKEFSRGALGIFHAKYAVNLMLASALKLKKFGA